MHSGEFHLAHASAIGFPPKHLATLLANQNSFVFLYQRK